MKISLYSLIASMLFFASCQNDNSSSNNSSTTDSYEAPPRELTEEELQQQLLDKECSHPADYIDGTVNAEARFKGLLSLKVNGIKLKFKLNSSATLATIKDIDVNVNFKSKTGSTVLQRDLTLYEFIKPGGAITYKTEIDCSNQQWNDIDHWEWSVIGSDCM